MDGAVFPLTAIYLGPNYGGTSLVVQMVKHLTTMQETQVQLLGGEDLLEKGMATHSSILALPTKRNTHTHTHTHTYTCAVWMC